MADLIVANKSDLVNIADAVRSKTGSTETMALDEMPTAISGISGGGAAIETCKVYIDWYSAKTDGKVFYMGVENGDMKAKSISSSELREYEHGEPQITDAVTGTLLMVADNDDTSSVVYNVMEGEAELLWQLNGWNPGACFIINSDCRILGAYD